MSACVLRETIHMTSCLIKAGHKKDMLLNNANRTLNVLRIAHNGDFVLTHKCCVKHLFRTMHADKHVEMINLALELNVNVVPIYRQLYLVPYGRWTPQTHIHVTRAKHTEIMIFMLINQRRPLIHDLIPLICSFIHT